MAIFAITALSLIWVLWFLGTWTHSAWVGFLVPLGYAFAGMVLTRIRLREGLPIQSFLRLLGVSLLLLALADGSWNLAFPMGRARLEDTLEILLVYVSASLVGAWASLGFYKYIRGLFGYPWTRIWIPLSLSLAVAAWSYWLGKSELSGYSLRDLWAFWLNVLLGFLGTLSATIVLEMAVSTRGGSFFRWTLPAGVGLFLLVISNMVYVDQGEGYAVGSLSDWISLLGTSALFVYGLWDLDSLAVDRPHP